MVLALSRHARRDRLAGVAGPRKQARCHGGENAPPAAALTAGASAHGADGARHALCAERALEWCRPSGSCRSRDVRVHRARSWPRPLLAANPRQEPEDEEPSFTSSPGRRSSQRFFTRMRWNSSSNVGRPRATEEVGDTASQLDHDAAPLGVGDPLGDDHHRSAPDAGHNRPVPGARPAGERTRPLALIVRRGRLGGLACPGRPRGRAPRPALAWPPRPHVTHGEPHRAKMPRWRSWRWAPRAGVSA